jgi:phage terminase large subunit
METIEVAAEFPPKCAGLFEPHRFKILYGGRGSAKSWSVARALLLIGQQKELRILCLREYMNSIADSQHRLLSDQIRELHLDDFYIIENKAIYGRNGTEVLFAGLKTNPSIIRSFEKVNVAWLEEGQSISKTSIETLIPTIRTPDSEIWVTMNPILSTDYMFKRFIENPPKNAWVQKLNYTDNPWFPAVLREEMEEMKERSYEDYRHIYEGETIQFYAGSVYLDQLKAVDTEKRICDVKYDASAPVEVFFDIGWADATAIWVAQKVPGGEIHIIDHLESNRKTLDWYLKWLGDKPYSIQTIWYPHDARARNIGTGKSLEEMTRQKGYTVRIVPNLGLADGINAVRTILPQCWFDKERTEDGVQALRHYRYELTGDGQGGFKQQPVHDRYSHSCDAFRMLAVALKAPKKSNFGKYSINRPFIAGHRSSWMQI